MPGNCSTNLISRWEDILTIGYHSYLVSSRSRACCYGAVTGREKTPWQEHSKHADLYLRPGITYTNLVCLELIAQWGTKLRDRYIHLWAS